MNRFISFFALLAVASAAPASKSDADAAIHILGRAPIIGVGGLTTYANGAQVPTDTPAVAAATAQHLAVKGTPILQDVAIAQVGYAGYGGWPYSHYIGKREAESEADPAIYIAGRAPVLSVGHLTTYANGAVVPTDTPSVAAATTQHLAAKGTPILQDVVIPHVGYAGYPYAAHLIGKREAESEADPAIYIAGRAPVTSVGHLTTYANGAVVPTDTPAVAAVTAQHLALKGTPILQDVVIPHVGYAGYPYGSHLIGKREAESEADPAIYIAGRAPVTSVGHLTTYANGAVVPTDTPAVAAVTAQHLALKGTPILQDVVIPHVGYAGYPYGAHLIGKREAESEADPAIYIAGRAPVTSVGHLTTYANGAVVPTDTPAVAAVTAQHLALKGTPILQDVVVPHVGYAGYAGWPIYG